MARPESRRHGRKQARNRRQDRAGDTLLHHLAGDAGHLLGPMVRSHWAIENSLHWVMDMVFRDDECRVRTDNAPANFTTIKHMAHNLIRNAPGRTHSASGAKPQAGTTTFSQASSPHDSFTRFPWYLIVFDKDGIRVVHGQNPKLVGKSYFNSVDVNGKEYGKDAQQIAAGPGTGWISFAFKDLITGKVLPKESYVERAGDYSYIAGVYAR